MAALETLRQRARELKVELIALALAARHPETPWYAKLIVAGCVAYALTPVDLIPDAIPVIGLIDDLIFIPLAITLAVRFIPAPVLADCRLRSREIEARPPRPPGAGQVLRDPPVLIVGDEDDHAGPLRACPQAGEELVHMLVAAREIRIARVLIDDALGLVERDRRQRAFVDVAEEIVAVFQVLRALGSTRRKPREVIERLVMGLEDLAGRRAGLNNASLD